MFFKIKYHFIVYLLFSFFILIGCQLQEPLKSHGIIFLENRANKLILDTSNDFKPKIKNVCSGKGTSVLEFASYWWNKWNAKGNLIPNKLLDRKDEPVRFVGSL